MDTLMALHLPSMSWKHIETLPDPLVRRPGYPFARNSFSCAQYKTWSGQDEVCITGGHRNFVTGFTEIWTLNLATKQWRLFQHTQLPSPLTHHFATINSNGRMTIVEDFDHPTAVRRQRPSNQPFLKMWLKVPKLSDICLEAMLHYNPAMGQYTNEYLRQAGVPKHLANQISTKKTPPIKPSCVEVPEDWEPLNW